MHSLKRRILMTKVSYARLNVAVTVGEQSDLDKICSGQSARGGGRSRDESAE